MKKLTLGFLLLVISFTAYSQKVYFIYLQTEGEQPFFVKMNNKIYSSSETGYLILSKLKDTTYNFSVGFPQSKLPEQHFTIAVHRKDHGYLVKNFAEKGWGLFDLQTLAVQMTSTNSTKANDKSLQENSEVSPFTAMLSKAADDPALAEKESKPKAEDQKNQVAEKYNEKNEQKTVLTNSVEVKKEALIASMGDTVTAAKEITVEKNMPTEEDTYHQSVVTRKSESSTTEGFRLVFIDNYKNDKKDTIRILIPNPKPFITSVIDQPKEVKKFIEIAGIDSVNKADINVIKTQSVPTDTTTKREITNPDCNSLATESDFFKLRKIMAAAEGDDEMIAEARKYFKIQCFTAEQVKNLSLLFLNDAGKYKFFDVAYDYVADVSNFILLQKELKEEYYITRFKAMLRN
jgi:hypothetical protein